MKLTEGEVKIKLSEDWQIKTGVRIPEGTELAVSSLKESQLEKAGIIENRKRTVKTKNDARHGED